MLTHWAWRLHRWDPVKHSSLSAERTRGRFETFFTRRLLVRHLIISYESRAASWLSHISSAWRERRVFFFEKCLFQTCSRDNFAMLITWTKTKTARGWAHSWVGELWVLIKQTWSLDPLLPKHIFTWSRSLPINTDEENMWSCAVIHLVIYRIWMWLQKISYMAVPVASWSKTHNTSF